MSSKIIDAIVVEFSPRTGVRAGALSPRLTQRSRFLSVLSLTINNLHNLTYSTDNTNMYYCTTVCP
jgi:hypothetical protein